MKRKSEIHITKLLTVTILFGSSISAMAERVDYFDSIQNRIFNVSCIGCHGKYNVSIKNVDLTSYDKLVENDSLIIPEKPEESLLYQKAVKYHGGLSRSELDDLYDWIFEGAENN